MKEYRTKISSHIVFLVLDLVVVGFSVFVYLNEGYVPIDFLLPTCFFAIFLLLGHLILCTSRLVISDSMLSHTVLSIWTRAIRWEDVSEVSSTYLLYPESEGILTLTTNKEGAMESLSIFITAYPIEALREILRHVPQKVSVHIYKYLQRKLDNKQTLFMKE